MTNSKLFVPILCICLLVAMIAAIFSAGCATPSSTTNPTTTTPAQTVIELKLADYDAAGTHLDPVWADFEWRVEARSGGTLKVKYIASGTLLDSSGMLEGIRTGVADIGKAPNSYYPAELPFNQLLALPGISSNALLSTKILNDMKDDYYYQDWEALGLVPLSYKIGSTYNPYSPKQPLTSLDDLKGLKCRTPGGAITDALESLGAVPINVTFTEVYDACQKGVIDCVPHGQGLLFAYLKLHELGDPGWWLDIGGLGAYVCTYFTNQQLWDSLSPEHQQILDEELDRVNFRWAEQDGGRDAEALQLASSNGVIINTISSAELELMSEYLQPIVDEYIVDIEAQGFPAQETLDEFLKRKSEFTQYWSNMPFV